MRISETDLRDCVDQLNKKFNLNLNLQNSATDSWNLYDGRNQINGISYLSKKEMSMFLDGFWKGMDKIKEGLDKKLNDIQVLITEELNFKKSGERPVWAVIEKIDKILKE